MAGAGGDDESTSTAVFGRISEALGHVATGLAKNPSLTAPEMLLYLHATLAPYVTALVRQDLQKRRARGELVRGSVGGGDEGQEGEEDNWRRPGEPRQGAGEVQGLH